MNLRPLIHYLSGIRDRFFQSSCILCQQHSDEILCQYCMRDCELASFPVPGSNLLELPGFLAQRELPVFHSLYAIGWYEKELAQLINQLKFGSNPLAAVALAKFFQIYVLERLGQIDDLPDLAIPVPLSQLRLLKRAYNQALLIALELQENNELVIFHHVRRIRNTKQQSKLDKRTRLKNVEGAFKLQGKIESKHLCIIDDVFTTGATVNQIADEILKHTPDTKISVWCMAVAKLD